MRNKIDFFRLGLFTLVLILIYALHQRFDIPALVSFFMFGSVVIFAFMLGLEKDSLENLIDYLEQYTADFLEINRIDFDFIIESDIPELSLNGETRRNILLTLKEALHNISKHAKATMVYIQIEIVDKKLRILIKDNGIGINKDKLNQHGNGLKNMRRRIESTGGTFEIEVVDGTIIRLNIPMIAIKQS